MSNKPHSPADRYLIQSGICTEDMLRNNQTPPPPPPKPAPLTQAQADEIAMRKVLSMEAGQGMRMPTHGKPRAPKPNQHALNADALLKQGANLERVLVEVQQVGEPESARTVHVPNEILARIILQIVGDAIPHLAIQNALKGVENRMMGQGPYDVSREVVAELLVIGVTVDNAVKIEKGVLGWQLTMYSRIPALREEAAKHAAAERESMIERGLFPRGR